MNITITFTSDFGKFQETVEVERLLSFDFNGISYEHFKRMPEAQQESVLYNCTVRYFEHKFNLVYQLD